MAGAPWPCRWRRWRARRPARRRSRRRTRSAFPGWWLAAGRPPSGLRRGRALAASRGSSWCSRPQRRRTARAPCLRGIVPPQELLLDDREIAALWQPVDRRHRPRRRRSARCARRPTAGTGRCGWRSRPPAARASTAGAEEILRSRPCGSSCATRCSTPSRRRSASSSSTLPTARPGRAAPGRTPGGCSTSAACGSKGRSATACRGCSPPRSTASAARRRPCALPDLPCRPAAGAGGGAAGPPLVYVLGLLGSPVARQRDEEGEHDLDWRLRRSFQVLAFLASAPGLQAGREELIEAVWPTEGERTIERNFHPTLSHLRRALEGGNRGKDRPAPLLFRNGVYRLNPEVGWEIDTHRVHPPRGRGEGSWPAAAMPRPPPRPGSGPGSSTAAPSSRGITKAGSPPAGRPISAATSSCCAIWATSIVRLGRSEEAMDAYRSSWSRTRSRSASTSR